MRLALIQTTSPADQVTALDHIRPLIERAASLSPDLIFTPEGSNLMAQGPDRAQKIVALDQDVFVAGMADTARHLHIPIIVGSVIVRAPDAPYPVNRALVLGSEGQIRTHYDKIHLFDADTPDGKSYRESQTISPGSHLGICDVAGARVGLSICYDLRFASLYRALAKAGANIICANAAFTVPTGQAHWEVLIRARAIETGAFMVAAAQGGRHEDGRVTFGHSLVVSPWGEVLARLDHDRPDVLSVDIDLTEVDKARGFLPQLRHDREFRL